jgi:hypothetical protein
MRFARVPALLILLLVPTSHADPQDVITNLLFSPQALLDVPFDEIRHAETCSLDDLVEKDRKAVLARVAALPKLTTLKLYGCDLSRVDEKDPVPAKVKSLLISGGKVSQGTIRWLAKFPAGVEVGLACDLRGLDLDLGAFKWVFVQNCRMSRSAVAKLVEKTTQVTFKEVELVDDP